MILSILSTLLLWIYNQKTRLVLEAGDDLDAVAIALDAARTNSGVGK
jgi:hypothetical protein